MSCTSEIVGIHYFDCYFFFINSWSLVDMSGEKNYRGQISINLENFNGRKISKFSTNTQRENEIDERGRHGNQTKETDRNNGQCKR